MNKQQALPSIAFAGLMAGLLSGCGDPAVTTTSVPVTAQLDEGTGQVVLPLDRYRGDAEDGNLFRMAHAAAVAVCAREQGVMFTAPRYVEQPVNRSELFLGPWTMAQAEKFGFVQPAPDADLRANGFVPADYGEPSKLNTAEVGEANSRLSEADMAVVEECGKNPPPFSPPPECPWIEPIYAAMEDAATGAAATKILDDLYDCYEAAGIGRNDRVPGLPAGVDGTVIDEEQITLAIKSVQCKQELNTTQDLANLLAAAQAPVLAEYENEVTENRAAYVRARDQATTYMADHPEVFEIP